MFYNACRKIICNKEPLFYSKYEQPPSDSTHTIGNTKENKSDVLDHANTRARKHK